jgi:hypothetical protein
MPCAHGKSSEEMPMQESVQNLHGGRSAQRFAHAGQGLGQIWCLAPGYGQWHPWRLPWHFGWLPKTGKPTEATCVTSSPARPDARHVLEVTHVFVIKNLNRRR